MREDTIIIVVGVSVGVIIILTATVYLYYKYRRIAASDVERTPLVQSNRSSMRPDEKAPSNDFEQMTLIARMYLRSTTYTNLDLLPEINTRKSKYYFTIKNEAKQEFLLVLVWFFFNFN